MSYICVPRVRVACGPLSRPLTRTHCVAMLKLRRGYSVPAPLGPVYVAPALIVLIQTVLFELVLPLSCSFFLPCDVILYCCVDLVRPVLVLLPLSLKGPVGIATYVRPLRLLSFSPLRVCPSLHLSPRYHRRPFSKTRWMVSKTAQCCPQKVFKTHARLRGGGGGRRLLVMEAVTGACRGWRA